MEVEALTTLFGPLIARLERGWLTTQEVKIMETKFWRVRNSFALIILAALISIASAGAQTITPQTPDSDTTRRQLAEFDRFLDSHPEVASQLRQDPSLVNNPEFVENHSELQQYLQQHPEVREEIKENPNAFMNREQRFERHDADGDRRDKDSDNDRNRRDRDTTRGELADFDHFLDSHPELAEKLRQEPSLINNHKYVSHNHALRDYLKDHPEVREELKENPNAFMRQEQRFDRRDDVRDRDVTRGELASMDRFLDSHPEIAEQLRRDPSLVNDRTFVKNHPALQEFFEQHPGVREEVRENPNGFMHQEQRFDRREDARREDYGDRDVTRGELASMDRFLDSHPEIAEQLRKNPSLVKNREFVENHPALEEYLQQHPQVREEVAENPNGFMHQEQRFDHHEDMRGDHDTTQAELASFGQFLGSHSTVAEQLSKDPSLAKNQEYRENHPELQQYLSAHPRVQQELTENPQAFVKSAQRFSNTKQPPPTAPKTPIAEPKTKQ